MTKYKHRTDGRYEAKINVGFNLKTGRPIRVTIYGKTIKELEKNRAETLVNYRKGMDLAKRTMTFDEYKTIWINTKTECEPKTIEMYNRIIKLCTILDKMAMVDITRAQIQSIIDANADHARTCQQIKNVLNQIFKLAIIDRLIYFNPVEGVVLPKYKVEPKRALTDYENILSEVACFSDRERAYVYLIKYLGLRREEALALCQTDFDLINRTVTINKAITWVNNRPILKDTKTEAGKRTLALSDTLYNFIVYYISNLQASYLFTNIKDKCLITLTSFKRMWESIIKKMNSKAAELGFPECKGLTSHIFRHNFTTILAHAGVSLDERKYLLGHSSINVTIDVYTHIESASNTEQKKINDYWNLQNRSINTVVKKSSN